MNLIARIPEAQVDKRRPKVAGLERCSSHGSEQGASNGRRERQLLRILRSDSLTINVIEHDVPK